MSTEQTATAGAKPKPMTKEEIAAKIAAGRAKGTTGTAATLAEPPMPKETKTKAQIKKQQVQTAKAEKAPKVLNACGCGCLQPCKSNFIPGHDAKLHSQIKKLARGQMALSELAEQVREGMYKKVKQATIKGTNEKGEKTETLAGVEPTVSEADYLATLKGLGGPAA